MLKVIPIINHIEFISLSRMTGVCISGICLPLLLISCARLVQQRPITEKDHNKGSLKQNAQNIIGKARCGMPTNNQTEIYRWNKNYLTYKIQNVSEPWTKRQVKDIFEKSLKSWLGSVNLNITESTSSDADILLHFNRQQDDKTDDQITLAYAYFPEVGDIYLNQTVDWTLDRNEREKKIYMGWVVAHELGHALGLDHNEDEAQASVMFPSYQTQITEASEIDRDNLVKIYGEFLDTYIPWSGTSFDAIVFIDPKNNLLIKDNLYWKLERNVLNSGPFHLNHLFPEIPKKIDAAFAVNKKVYFLKKNVYYRYSIAKKTYRKKLISVGFDNAPSDIDAAIFIPADHTVYFFKGSKYYELDMTKPIGQRLKVNGKTIGESWEGVPDDIEAASFIGNNTILFVKDSLCYIVDYNSRKVSENNYCSNIFL